MPSSLLEFAIGCIAILAGLFLAQYLLLGRQKSLGSEARLPRQLTLLGLTIASLVVLVVISPIDPTAQIEILQLIGLLTSGVLAFASTSFVTNFMAAIMLRVTRPFEIGDFITIKDQFGKVAERGLFDTEIQTEMGELIAIPNAAFIGNSVKVIDKDGTIISTTLSLGYDVHHERIEALLIKAAKSTELEDPYVHILELGDYSVKYRVNGFLSEAKTLLSARSRLNASVLDTLHGAGIEIMSPAYARHIQHPLDQSQIPTPAKQKAPPKSSSVEDVAFVKANQAEALKELKRELKAEISDMSERMSDAAGEEKDRLQGELEALENKLAEANDAKTDDKPAAN